MALEAPTQKNMALASEGPTQKKKNENNKTRKRNCNVMIGPKQKKKKFEKNDWSGRKKKENDWS